jgi:DNA polymerase-3 subunit delta'
MNEQAANALLKTLEEPEPTTHLILTTTNPTALPATIRHAARQSSLHQSRPHRLKSS